MKRKEDPQVSVLMPTYDHAAFIGRAIESLFAQRFSEWELIVLNDGSPDETGAAVQPYLVNASSNSRADARLHYHTLERNVGLGAALNRALRLARAPLIAYLPSDDAYFPDHLASLVACLNDHPHAVAACSGIRHHFNKSAPGPISGSWLQLAQVMHRRTPDLWTERAELVTDDLGRMYWSKLEARGDFVGTGEVTCEWTDHPLQRHKLLREPAGGLNPYRTRFRVAEPLRMHSSIGNFCDEVELYRSFRERPDTPQAPDSLKIVLAGELAYNGERVLALEERGHRLYGLWTPAPHWWNTVGPLPFGHVEELPREGWRRAMEKLKPDVIYALLNWQAIAFAHHVLEDNPGIPFVWHLKEAPSVAMEKGLWPRLLDLYRCSQGQIYCSPEMRDWFFAQAPGLRETPSLVLDGDLPKRDWFRAQAVPPLSASDGELHTVVPGRPIGLHPQVMGELARERIHVHFYGDFTQQLWRDWIERVSALAEGYFHLHANVDQRRWVAEFSQYDAGWLHFFESGNRGDLRRMTFDDMNYPARIGPLVAAGLPLLQRDNAGAVVATQSLARDCDIGLFFRSAAELRAGLDDRAMLQRLRENVSRQRERFTFDFHADRLIAFFRQVIASASWPAAASYAKSPRDQSRDAAATAER
jgi:hypothetical protein